MTFNDCTLLQKAKIQKRKGENGEKLRILDILCDTKIGPVVFRMYEYEHRCQFSTLLPGVMLRIKAKKTKYFVNRIPRFNVLYISDIRANIKEDELQ